MTALGRPESLSGSDSRDVTGAAVTIVDILHRAASDHPAKTAVVDGARRLTFAELYRSSDDFAAGLVDLGVRRGDRVAIWMPNCLEWVVSFFGAVRAGAVVVPLNTALAGSEAEYQIRQSGSTVIICGSDVRGRHLAQEALELSAMTEVGTVVCAGGPAPEGARSWQEVARPVIESATLPVVDARDPVVMLYTSGTTGAPKGAVHSHGFLAPLMSAGERLRLTPEDCVVLYLPLFHVYALMAGLVLLASSGSKIVLMGQFDAALSLDLMEQERATVVYGVPTTYIDQLNAGSFEHRDLSPIRLCVTPFPRDLAERVRSRFGPCVNTFGMTETASIAFLPAPDDPADIALGTVGRPLEGLEARVVDPETRSLRSAGEQGLLQLRGPQILSHYHENPEATSSSFDVDGWFSTGDIAVLDADGNLTFVGRSGDHFKVGGELVDPVEVEMRLQSHPLVERAAVAGVQHERLGAVPHAWVKLTETIQAVNSDALIADIVEYAKQDLAYFKVPRAVHVVDEFPVTPSGKVQKFKLVKNL